MLVMFTSPLALRNSDIPSYPHPPHPPPPNTQLSAILQPKLLLRLLGGTSLCVYVCVCVCNNGLWCVDVSFKLFTGCVCLKHS